MGRFRSFCEERINLEPRGSDCVGDFMRRVLADVRDVSVILCRISREHLWIMSSVEHRPHAGQARYIRCCNYQPPTVREYAPTLDQQVHWVMQEMLDQFATQNEIERRVRIRINM